nr:MAG TPA: hypothetical protein [Caudoviricetes sp.]
MTQMIWCVIWHLKFAHRRVYRTTWKIICLK